MHPYILFPSPLIFVHSGFLAPLHTHDTVRLKKKKKRRARGLRVVRGEGENVSPRIMGMKEEAGRVAKLQRTLRRPHVRVQSHCENK